jgi:hypothetical protein
MSQLASAASTTVSLAVGSWIKVPGGNFSALAILGPGPQKGQQINLGNGEAVIGPFPAAQDVYITSQSGAFDYHVFLDADTELVYGTAHRLASFENGKTLVTQSGSAVTITVPSGLVAGFGCAINQAGAGQVTFSGSGATINNVSSHTKTSAQYATVALVETAANTYTLSGSTAA